VQLRVRPGAGELTSKFMSIEDTSMTFADLYFAFGGKLSERETALVGSLVSVKIQVGDVEADTMSIYDQMNNYTEMLGVSSN
jgi:hypothetical protein